MESSESLPPPPNVTKTRNPWKVFGVLVIALVVIGGAVGVGFLLAGGSEPDDAQSATTLPPTTAQPTTTVRSEQPTTTVDTLEALGIDGDDGRLSQLEYEQALDILRSEGLSSSQLEGLNRTIMEGSGEAFCASLDYFQDTSDAREDYRQFLATDMSAEMVDRAMSVAALASIQMCISLIESLS